MYQDLSNVVIIETKNTFYSEYVPILSWESSLHIFSWLIVVSISQLSYLGPIPTSTVVTELQCSLYC